MIGVCYYPEHWPENMWQKDAQEMRELGIKFVRLAEFSWSKLEPKENEFNFDWLDRAIMILAQHDIKIILCTPTATPPKWLIDKYPSILPVNINTGVTRGFGSRRHYDFSSPDYFDASMKITQIMAQRYANNSAVVGWQTDNELACHDTTHSGSENALAAFQAWCKNQYGDIDTLNDKWGTIFWSMEYQDFTQIELPFLAVTETHPSHQLAYRRFSSDQVIRYHNAMINEIRQHCSHQFVTHNFIPMVDTQCDNFALADQLDFASYDNYPLGRTDLFFANSETNAFAKYMRTGHPDFSSYSFDQIRGISHDHFWVMEQQPGPVNWGSHNPRPHPGMVYLWSWEAVAHGASTVCYFRWRQAAFAQEQMHAGIKRVDNSKSIAWHEAKQFNQDLALTGFDLSAKVSADVAIVMDSHNQWVTEIERQGDSYQHQQVEFSYYSAFRKLGLNVDFIAQDSDLSPYKLVIAPCLPIIHNSFIERCKLAQVHLVVGPRTGSKTEELCLSPNLGPGALQQLIDIKVISVETLRKDCVTEFFYNNTAYQSERWNEELIVGDNVEIAASLPNGQAIVVQNEKVTYVASLTNDAFLLALFTSIANKHSLSTVSLPQDIRLSWRGEYGVLLNYGGTHETVELPFAHECILGSLQLAPYSVSVIKKT